jgi:hypothetical protein
MGVLAPFGGVGELGVSRLLVVETWMTSSDRGDFDSFLICFLNQMF